MFKHVFYLLLAMMPLCTIAEIRQTESDFNRLRDQKSLLDLLDKTMERRQHYIDIRQQEIDVLKEQLRSVSQPLDRLFLYSALYNRYGSLNNDSAFVYAELAYDMAHSYGSEVDQQRTSIDLAYCYSLSGLYDQGYRLMPSRQEVLPEVLLNYYIAQCSFLQWQSEFTTIPKLKKQLIGRSRCYHDSILLTDSNPLHQLQERVQIEGMMSREEAISRLEAAIDSLPASEDYIRYMALMTATIFEERQQADSAIVFFAISAISDMQHGILEHASLQRLAALLFEQGSVERAYRYMDCCLKDARQSGVRLRSLELQANLDVIMNTYNDQILRQQNVLRLILLVVLVLLAVVLVISWWLNRLRRDLKRGNQQLLAAHSELKQSHSQVEQALAQLRRANEQLEQTNVALRESNRVKDSLVAQYMKYCHAGIGQLRAYQQKLMRLLMTHSTDLLEETIRNTESLDAELETFYCNFDETFLYLFPDFVKELNTLLREDEQYPLMQSLSTELRVFALMRLGVSSLDEIADFLRCSPKTVLNYRSRLRQKARIDKDELDRWITGNRT